VTGMPRRRGRLPLNEAEVRRARLPSTDAHREDATASILRPPRVPLPRVNHLLSGVKGRQGVSKRLSAHQSPDQTPEPPFGSPGRDAAALAQSTPRHRRAAPATRKPPENWPEIQNPSPDVPTGAL